MSTAQNWSVTTTVLNTTKREWGARLEWLGLGYVLALQVNIAPAVRIVLFGWSLYVGRLLKVTKITENFNDIAASKGWAHQPTQEQKNVPVGG